MRLLSSLVILLVCVVVTTTPSLAISAMTSDSPFTISDATWGQGADQVHLKVIHNTKNDEQVYIVTDVGGRVEELHLRAPSSGILRSVLQGTNNTPAHYYFHLYIAWIV
jgi:hypothetical protein